MKGYDETTMPAVRTGGHPTGWNDGGRLSVSNPHDTTAPTARQVEPPHIALLRQLAEHARMEDDRPLYLLARRWFLLCQAAVKLAEEGQEPLQCERDGDKG